MKVVLSKHMYHLQQEMIQWCRDNIGLGGWEDSPALLFPDRPQWVWTVKSTFGDTTFTFRDDEQGKLFKEKWL